MVKTTTQMLKQQRAARLRGGDEINIAPHEVNDESHGPELVKTTTATGKKDLGMKYRQVEQRIDEISRQLDAALAQRSRVAEEIYNSIGPGPFEINGRVVRIVKREREESGPLFFFREFRTPPEVETLG